MKILSQLSLSSARRRGLTLIEIMVVTVLFAIIAVSLFVVFKAGLDSWRRTQGHIEMYQSARTALDMMTRELSSAYLNSSNPAITFRGFMSASRSGWVSPSGSSEIFFIAALNPSLNYSDAAFELCKVGYYVDTTANQLMKYFYYVKNGTTPNWNFADNTNVTYTKIASNVTRFSCLYYDVDGGLYASWDSTIAPNIGKKPAKIEISLTVKEPNSTKTEDFTTGVYIPQ